MNKTRFTHGSIKVVPKESGLSIEETIRQAIATNQPIDGKAPMIYTPAKDGVLPETDIRTDKQELALAAQDKYQASDHMRNYIGQTEYDENGYDGNGNKREDTQQKQD